MIFHIFSCITKRKKKEANVIIIQLQEKAIEMLGKKKKKKEKEIILSAHKRHGGAANVTKTREVSMAAPRSLNGHWIVLDRACEKRPTV